MSEPRNLMFLVTGPEPHTQWSYVILDQRDVYDRTGELRTGAAGKLRELMEALARKSFLVMCPGVPAVAEGWREVPASKEEWEELIHVD